MEYGQDSGTLSHRDKLHSRWGMLKAERASWFQHWKECSEFILPRNGRYFRQDRNRGQRRHNNIYDNTGTRALRVLGAGLMGGATSPARPWFRLTTADRELAERDDVKRWLAECTSVMLSVFAKSNTYRALHSTYEELGCFGTGALILAEDYETTIHNYQLTVGEYAIQQDYQGRVCTLYREFEKTVGEVVKEFGIENVSRATKNLLDRGALDTWVPIIHAIEPRADRDTSKRDSKNMPFKSCYFELGADRDMYLRESGFEQFPGLCPRWGVSGGDVYGNSPGMEALGDIKQLQHQQLRKSQAIDYQVQPPLQVPASMKNRDIERMPGGISYYDMAAGANGANGAIKTAFDVNLRLDHLQMDMAEVRMRIDATFYKDLFLMLASQTDARMTATEVAERHEEKLLMLGPVVERLHDELLSPLVERTFMICLKGGMLPPPPQDVQGADLDIEFVSMLAQAQRAIATNGVDRFVSNLGAIAQFKPDVLDKFDADKWADVYGDMLGVDPELIVPSDQVALIRQARAQQQAQAAAAEQALQQSQAIKNLATAPTAEQSALTDPVGMFSGYAGLGGVL